MAGDKCVGCPSIEKLKTIGLTPPIVRSVPLRMDAGVCAHSGKEKKRIARRADIDLFIASPIERDGDIAANSPIAVTV
jgi:metal-dependent amidase/aminoacylase/carboxypeptidase family protein